MALYKTSMLYCFTLRYSFNVYYRDLLFKLKKYNNVSLRSYVEISVHVEADDSKMVGAGHIGDDALSAFPLLRHSHPHVPIPQLQEKTHTKSSQAHGRAMQVVSALSYAFKFKPYTHIPTI